MRKPTNLLYALAVVMAAITLGSCGGESGVSVDDVWARTSPGMANAGAVYMDLNASDADRLIGVTVDASIAARAEVHETAMAGAAEGMAEGTMTMREIEAIELPAGATVSLEPGGFHVMLMDLAAPLETGDSFDVTLVFAEAGEQRITVEVREDAP